MIERDLREIDHKLVEQASLSVFAGMWNGTGIFTRLFLWYHRRKIIQILDREFSTNQSTVMYRALHGHYGPPLEPKQTDWVKTRVAE
jgi:hypothetical protein